MKYLTLSADYESFLQNDYDSSFSYEELNIPLPLLHKILHWYGAYLPIISMNEQERESAISLIDELDLEGLELLKNLNTALNGEVKIKYYSEGRLKYL